jgi:hypothetical protein
MRRVKIRLLRLHYGITCQSLSERDYLKLIGTEIADRRATQNMLPRSYRLAIRTMSHGLVGIFEAANRVEKTKL